MPPQVPDSGRMRARPGQLLLSLAVATEGGYQRLRARARQLIVEDFFYLGNLLLLALRSENLCIFGRTRERHVGT
jgi:hypothetical protein